MIRKMLLAAAIMGAALALSAQIPAAGQSAYPTRDYTGVSGDYLANRLSLECMSSGFVILERSPNVVLCQRQMQLAQAAATMFLMGGFRSGVAPTEIVRFSIALAQPGVWRVQGSAIVQTGGPFGQARQAALDNPQAYATIQGVLDKLGR